MVDRTQISAAQQIGQLARVNLVTLVTLFHERVFPRIAHHELRDVWLQEVIQPRRPGPLFQSHTQVTVYSLDTLQDGARLGFDDRLHHHFSLAVHHRDYNRFLVNVHANILNVHTGAPFARVLLTLKTYLKGAPPL